VQYHLRNISIAAVEKAKEGAAAVAYVRHVYSAGVADTHNVAP
jgi:hypothetical protein